MSLRVLNMQKEPKQTCGTVLQELAMPEIVQGSGLISIKHTPTFM